MTGYLRSVPDMLADIGAPSEAEFHRSDRPPHPDSLGTGPLVDFCKKSSAEQLWELEERRFEKRLAVAVRLRQARGTWTDEQLTEYVSHHRQQWRESRLDERPRIVRDRDDRFVQVCADLEPPAHWQD